ncbi:sensor histidine kinase [Spirochaeta thermophila]|uniref:histidine kinase n=1 Tax=Winmispira thermophila (strain ATCC 49972 / DSM 6192 / RI 19.B1) TaxID=665571 RepID=E0RRA2_WINT6|nr:ATP-binding protein [Spirochaeta thermophila]ADN03079.1 integral membrane sensor signal transduction histidine kinase [Spirochaeta thermophila DSM 6192]
MRTLMGRILLAFGVGFGVFVFLFSVAVGVSARASLGALERTREARIRGEVVDALEEVAAEGRFGRAEVMRVLRPYAPFLQVVVVLDRERRPVAAWMRGEPGMGMRGMMGSGGVGDVPGEVWEGLRWDSVRVDGRVEGYVGLRVAGFGASEEEGALTRGFLVPFVTGGVVALIGSGGVLLLLVRDFARTARRMAEGLVRLARGERGVVFPDASIEELSAIGRAAVSLQEQLLREERLRAQWSQDVAHDLRTPIAALRAQLEGMRDGVLQVSGERVSLVLDELARIEALIEDLALLTRVEDPARRGLREEVALGRVAAEVVERLRMLGEGREVEVSVEDEGVVLGEGDLLVRMVENLVRNGFQHASGEGPVRVRVERAGAEVVLQVENPGRIGEEELPLVFERLYRGERGRHSRGSGLGLAIVRAVVEGHGGRVEAASAEGWVRFTVRLPASS